ncbi:MAG: hypothetical protein ABJQ34_02015 [Paracoccaceae bacterium]
MTSSIIIDPLVPLPFLIALALIVIAGILLAVWRGLKGWALRGLAALVVLGALIGPSFQQEDRGALTDIVILAEDSTSSQLLSDRPLQTEQALADFEASLTARNNTEVVRVMVEDGEDDAGTRLLSAINTALAELPTGRVSGIVAVTDGQIHDQDVPVSLPAPLHVLLTGKEADWDRRLVVTGAPAFAIIDEAVTLTLKIEDMGAVPAIEGDVAELDVSVDGGAPQRFNVRVGVEIDVPVTLPHGGRNVIQFTVPTEDGELTDRNNTALIQMNGVRDRLRVLLVSGEPHPGGRTWRNLLKSDSSVDLVHFTILRPPEKQDGVPVSELSLIAFPTRELFLEKIDDFDLIIFDRYKRRGILPALYIDNVGQYVRDGGAVLVAAGPDFASADSLFRSPLGPVLPAEPTARVLEQAYLPKVTDLGERHPVTTALPASGDWGRWLRQVELQPRTGSTVMEGIDGRPLLILDRVGEGRVALLASDHMWLWHRGYEGGGPQLEMLRRLAHWMMKEPELEEEALTADPTGQRMLIRRQTLKEDVPPVIVTGPDGSETELTLTPAGPGRFETTFEGPEIGLYRLKNGDLTTVIGLGPAAPREFEQTVASGDALKPLVESWRGGILQLEDGVPRLRSVRAGRPASGRGWIGLTPREAYETLDVRQRSLLPPWLVLLLASGLIVAAWLREGQR